ncbi:MAG: hydrogenase expression/formation protein HypE [Bacteroidetes bacterium]|nr:hydrogenase expression/formation protein HypE [Bacteroidota bacterium]
MSTADLSNGPVCPIPISNYPNVLLAHGGGGKLSHQLISTMIAGHFDNPALRQLHDGAVVTAGGAQLAFSTDSYVISPIFFPGGNIGELSVYGTVNDLTMCGAVPKFISAGFIIEEGLPMEQLWRIVQAMKAAADRAGVQIVTGDTKVVDRGKGDGIFINTAGIGLIPSGRAVAPDAARPGDRIIVSGEIAQHGIAIMSVREGLEFETTILSDCAPLNGLVEAMYPVSSGIRVLRDPTRGGVASALNEIAGSARCGIRIHEQQIPVNAEVRGACELLGFDPLYVANEGKLLAFVAAEDADTVLAAMRTHPLGAKAAIIGEVVADHPGTVVMTTSIGSSRVVDMLSGEQLPRIC